MRLILIAALAGCHHHAAPATVAVASACPDVATHLRTLLAPTHKDQEQLGRMTQAAQVRCADDVWPVDARICIVETHALDDGHHCLDKLAPAQRIAFEAALHAALDAEHPKKKERLPAACLAYRATVQAYIACDKVPQAPRDAVKVSFDSSWPGLESTPDDELAMLDARCSAMVDASAWMVCP